MRFHWLLLSLFSFFLFVSPAEAGRLLFWRFDASQNRLSFTTDDRVQPKAQLIPNPTRVVIDLPGITLGRPNVTQPLSGLIKSIRVGQFDSQTTRLVIELAPGYTIDPQQVKIRGISPKQWTVDLPNPQPLPQSSNSLLTNPTNIESQRQNPLSPVSSPRTGGTTDFQVTRNGLFIQLDRNGDDRQTRVKRSEDNKSIIVELPGAKLPSSLTNQTLTVNNYGVSQIQFQQASTSPFLTRLTLQVSDNSPNWQVIYSRMGGVVLLPQGGLESFNPNAPRPSPSSLSNPSNPQVTTITSIELTNNNTQLVIRGDNNVRGSGRWNQNTKVYEIRIPNAQLSDQFAGPQLGRNSPVYQLKIRQEVGNTVVILVQPSLGIQFGSLSPLNSQLLALNLRSFQTSSVPPRSINVPPNSPNLPEDYTPTPTSPRVPKTGTLVILDPGHGGKDPGAIGLGGIQEKDIILAISLQVSQILSQKGVRVMMTRNSDYFVSLQGRTDMANQARADVFVSIHANSMGNGRSDVSGLEVYYFGDRSLADTIQRSILRTVNIQDRRVRKARFYVLRNSQMPSTLVEVGFVTGNEDAAKLTNPSYQRQMAEAIARGILEFIQRYRL